MENALFQILFIKRKGRFDTITIDSQTDLQQNELTNG